MALPDDYQEGITGASLAGLAEVMTALGAYRVVDPAVVDAEQYATIMELLLDRGYEPGTDPLFQLQKMIRSPKAQLWKEALGLFKQSLALSPDGGPSRAMAERCQIYQEAPPPEEWDGVFEQIVKK